MNLRNIAIIAHVDHGKTTLIDRLLAQSGSVRENQRVAERAMDSNDLERERGITILAKVTSVDLGRNNRINIVDTPGHADFGGEVERILNMVDGAILLVDAAEGPMPQTKFVLQKALEIGLRPIVAINKIDKPEEPPDDVINEVFDLFAALDADNDQLDFPMLYGSAKQGWMARDASRSAGRHVSTVRSGGEARAGTRCRGRPFRLLATTIEANPYLGRILTGRMRSGTVKPNQPIKALDRDRARRLNKAGYRRCWPSVAWSASR
jgi:GTP-binding protein